MIITFCVYAKNNESERLVKKSTQKVDKVKLTSNKHITCGTSTQAIWSDCWSVEVTITVCCDCELGVAALQATLIATQTANSLINTITILNEELPC
jgi:mannitol-specific phosphotransferase system IIBC component